MTVTRTTAAERAGRQPPFSRSRGFAPVLRGHAPLLAASLVALLALVLTAGATLQQLTADGNAAAPLDLSALSGAAALERELAHVFPDPAEQRFVAAAIVRAFDRDAGASPSHVGALSSVRVTAADVRAAALPSLRQRVESASSTVVTLPVLTVAQVAELKPSLVVRDRARFIRALWVSTLVYLTSFGFVALYWAWRGWQTERWLLPIALLLTGLGLAMMVSLQDPLRDRLLVQDFALGVALGCAALAVASSLSWQTSAVRRLTLLPLLAAVVLALLLIVFGSGPGTSDAKVNLFGVQPVELIRLLLVLYLAGYFASRWEFLRQLRERAFGGLQLPARFRVPRYDHVLPLLAGVVVALLLFFVQKDLGPALVFGCLFLALYGVARQEIVLVTCGLLLLLGGFAGGYVLGYPSTVMTRVAMWLSPWENALRGGDHVAQSLWAYASGGLTGMGWALGEPGVIPEAHTDMVLAALGEELGFVGLVAVALLQAALAWRGLRIARAAHTDYGVFLALGVTLNLALPALLIAGGTLGVFPLSGVATPFLSYGKSSMVANLAGLGVLYAVARESVGVAADQRPFALPIRRLSFVLAGLAGLLVLRAAHVQVFAADYTMAQSSLTPQADGVLRYQDNPRLRQLAASLPRATITDRRGLPLAVSRCEDLRAHEAALRGAGALADCDTSGRRHYPFGSSTSHLLGDVRTRSDWAASNTSFAERDHESTLRGFDDREQTVERVDPRTGRLLRVAWRDYSALVPLWRYRHRPTHVVVRQLLEQRRDLRMTIDAQLQLRLTRALDQQLAALRQTRGAVVVMDTASGDVLALVNAPRPAVPHDGSVAAASSLSPRVATLDRARYGLYPPGSTFKLVTAAAALRAGAGDTQFLCRHLPGGRVGNTVSGWARPIRDDELDREPHGRVDLRGGVELSCNAYFAQLAMHLGAASLEDTAQLFEIALTPPGSNSGRLRDTLPHAGYGQGDVQVTPFKMARVAAAIANGGQMPYGRWVDLPDDQRDRAATPVLSRTAAAQLASYMRGVVLRGTARTLAGVTPAIAGKTGTAEVEGAASHAWFAGFAPASTTRGRRVAFAILIENGGYGGRAAVPLAAEVVRAAREVGLLSDEQGSPR